MAPKSSSKASASAKKDSPAKLQFEQFDLGALVAQQLSGDQGSPASSKKRKAAPVSEGASHKVDIAQASPVKKERRSSPPAPGTDAYALLPPVSIPALAKAVGSGSPTNPTPDLGSTTSAGRPRRKITKTEKAKANVGLVKISESTLKAIGVADNSIGAGDDEIVVMPSSQPEVNVEPIKEDDIGGTPVQSTPSTPKVSSRPSPSPVDVSPGNSDDESAHSVEAEQSDSELNNVNVMLSPCPDPILEPLYQSLPPLPRLCEVKSFSGTVDSFRTPFAETCAGMRERDVQGILKALAFTKSGIFVNTARINPSELFVDNNRLRIGGSKSLAVGLMTGTITESFLVNRAEVGARTNPFAIHKITIAPFEQDWRRDVSVWGLLFKFHVIYGMMSANGIGFATRGEGKDDGWRPQSAPSSPVKKPGALKTVSSPLLAVSVKPTYPSSKSFDDDIPIYDGRARNGRDGFAFTDADFRRLSSWPVYRRPPSEVPLGSMVSVGYTLSTYSGNLGPILSSNIQFVILLATS